MIHVLLVEDEENLAAGLAFNLRNVGYDVTVAETAPRANEILDRVGEPFDLVILDRMLPGGDGLEIARRMRQDGDFTPILVLTARANTEEIIDALDAGVDDYLTKPFELDELQARLRVLLRRQAWTRASEPMRASVPPLYSFGSDCWIDFHTFEAGTFSGERVQLGRKEALLLRLLIEEEGKPVSRSRLLEEVWGAPGDLSTRTVDNFVLRLRRHFEIDSGQPRHIQTVRGIGYRFVK